MKIPDVINPNKGLSESSLLWYFVSLCLMGIAIAICFSAGWQDDGSVAPIYKQGQLTGIKIISDSNKFSIAPQVTSIVWAIIIYGALLARRYVRNFTNLPSFILVVCNIIFTASLIESFLPAQSVCLLKCLRWEAVTVNPQVLLIAAVLLSWIGMRSLSGAAIIVLGVAFLSRAQEMNVSLGLYGTFYVLSGFLSLMVQSKLPYMVPEGGWRMTLLQDFGVIQGIAAANVGALTQRVSEGASKLVEKTGACLVTADGSSGN